VTNQMLPVNSY